MLWCKLLAQGQDNLHSNNVGQISAQNNRKLNLLFRYLPYRRETLQNLEIQLFVA